MKQLIKKIWAMVLFGGFVGTLGLGSYVAISSPLLQIGSLTIDLTIPSLVLIMIVFSILASHALYALESINNEPIRKRMKLKKSI